MEKDAIRNQKVFVTLHAVIAFTTEYNRVKEEYERARKERDGTALNSWAARKQALEFVIRTLDLPITT